MSKPARVIRPPSVVTPCDAAKIMRRNNWFSRPADESRIIRNVTVVGAPYLPGQGLTQSDLCWCEYALEECVDLGFYVELDLNITAIDMRFGQDYLEPYYASIPADLVIVAMVPRSCRNPENMCFRDTGPDVQLSPHSAKKNIWGRSLKQGGAKIAIPFFERGKTQEINTKDLKIDGYIESRTKFRQALLNDGITTFWIVIAPLVRRDVARSLPRHNFPGATF